LEAIMNSLIYANRTFEIEEYDEKLVFVFGNEYTFSFEDLRKLMAFLRSREDLWQRLTAGPGTQET
jgi:hypothetical protein